VLRHKRPVREVLQATPPDVSSRALVIVGARIDGGAEPDSIERRDRLRIPEALDDIDPPEQLS
jgi:hypothetical protein